MQNDPTYHFSPIELDAEVYRFIRNHQDQYPNAQSMTLEVHREFDKVHGFERVGASLHCVINILIKSIVD